MLDLSDHKGKWVAYTDDDLIGSDEDPRVVVEAIREFKKNNSLPIHFYRIKRDDEPEGL